jgi:Uma2 family endonuclease
MQATIPEVDDVEHDNIVVLRDVSWTDYERVLKMRGERSAPRISYDQGLLQLMSPSRPHERVKSFLGRLVEMYCLEAGIPFTPFGSWTLKSRPRKSGVEADECYIFGPPGEKQRPDLAIEVEWSHGGIAKLDIYRRLGVREVWYWKRQKLTAWVLGPDGYVEQATSDALPGIRFEDLLAFLDHETASAAMIGYRDLLRSRGPG